MRQPAYFEWAEPQPKDRGCVVLDQPQRAGPAETLRLLFDTTAARRIVAAGDGFDREQ